VLSQEVIGMFKKRNKIGSSLGAGKSENRILRLLRSDKSFAVSLDSLEGRDQQNGFEGSWKEIGSPLLEAECKRAQALLSLQQNARAL